MTSALQHCLHEATPPIQSTTRCLCPLLYMHERSAVLGKHPTCCRIDQIHGSSWLNRLDLYVGWPDMYCNASSECPNTSHHSLQNGQAWNEDVRIHTFNVIEGCLEIYHQPSLSLNPPPPIEVAGLDQSATQGAGLKAVYQLHLDPNLGQ